MDDLCNLSLVDVILEKTQVCFARAWHKYGDGEGDCGSDKVPAGLEVKLFGSQLYGVVSEESDVDMLICLPPEHERSVHSIANLFLGCLRQEKDASCCKKNAYAYQLPNRTMKWQGSLTSAS